MTNEDDTQENILSPEEEEALRILEGLGIKTDRDCLCVDVVHLVEVLRRLRVIDWNVER